MKLLLEFALMFVSFLAVSWYLQSIGAPHWGGVLGGWLACWNLAIAFAFDRNNLDD